MFGPICNDISSCTWGNNDWMKFPRSSGTMMTWNNISTLRWKNNTDYLTTDWHLEVWSVLDVNWPGGAISGQSGVAGSLPRPEVGWEMCWKIDNLKNLKDLRNTKGHLQSCRAGLMQRTNNMIGMHLHSIFSFELRFSYILNRLYSQWFF